MKLHAPLLVAAISSCVSASPKASIYTFDQSSTAAKLSSGLAPTLSSQDVKLFLAHRLGLSIYERLGNAKDETLDLLNAFGGSQASLFSDGEDSLRRLLVIVEGLEKPAGRPESHGPSGSCMLIENLDTLHGSASVDLQMSESDDADWDGFVHELLDTDKHRRGAAVTCAHSPSSNEHAVVSGGVSSNDV